MINLTPHDMTLITTFGPRTIPPFAGGAARVFTTEIPCGYRLLNKEEGCGYPSIDTARRTWGGINIPDGLPDTDETLIVSSLVLEAAIREQHLLLCRMAAPDSGPSAIRESGRVVAVTRLIVA